MASPAEQELSGPRMRRFGVLNQLTSISPRPIEQIEERIAPLRAALLEHRLYGDMGDLDAVRLFMEHHVFAVWDFMSLLKGLQRRLCCVAVPWLPPTNASASRLINEIVMGEESDEDGQGGFASHFELYHRSMRSCGANTRPIDRFIHELQAGQSMVQAADRADVPAPSAAFMEHTFRVIDSGNLPAIASAFTFGREDLLPGVFQQIVDSINHRSGGKLIDFKYYLDRHIELDGDEHGPMAHRLIQSLCGSDEVRWKSAERAAEEALLARIELWDSIADAVANR